MDPPAHLSTRGSSAHLSTQAQDTPIENPRAYLSTQGQDAPIVIAHLSDMDITDDGSYLEPPPPKDPRRISSPVRDISNVSLIRIEEPGGLATGNSGHQRNSDTSISSYKKSPRTSTTTTLTTVIPVVTAQANQRSSFAGEEEFDAFPAANTAAASSEMRYDPEAAQQAMDGLYHFSTKSSNNLSREEESKREKEHGANVGDVPPLAISQHPPLVTTDDSNRQVQKDSSPSLEQVNKSRTKYLVLVIIMLVVLVLVAAVVVAVVLTKSGATSSDPALTSDPTPTSDPVDPFATFVDPYSTAPITPELCSESFSALDFRVENFHR